MNANDLPQAGETVQADPETPETGEAQYPSQLDGSAPMDETSTPSRLEFETLKAVVARLVLESPTGVQANLQDHMAALNIEPFVSPSATDNEPRG